MQGAHDWAKNLNRTFEGHGYYRSQVNPQIRSRVTKNELTLTSTWTDDVLGASSTAEGEALAKEQLRSSYEIKDIGEAKLILGMRISRNENGDVILSQRAYAERLLKRFNMQSCSPLTTPLPHGLSLSTEDCPANASEVEEMKKIPYRAALGSLMWMQVATRPDLSFPVNLLAHFAHNPGRAHWNALKHVLGYIKGTLDYGLRYRAGAPLGPVGYVDSDFAGCKNTRRSTEGNIFVVAGGPVSWETKRQDTVALSTVEAEFMAFSRATTQALWLLKYFEEVGLSVARPITIHADNNRAISISSNDKNHRRTKHIDVRHHFVKEHTEADDINFKYIPSSLNMADFLTKTLPRDTLRKTISVLDLGPQTSSAAVQGEC